MTRENYTIYEKQVSLKRLYFLCGLLLWTNVMIGQSQIEKLMERAEQLEYNGAFQQSLELRNQIKTLCGQEKDWENAAINYCNIGYSCWELKEHTLMKIHLDSALVIAQSKKLDEFGDAYATIWNYLGFYFNEKGNYIKTAEYYHKVLEIDKYLAKTDSTITEEIIGTDYYNLGVIFGKKGDYEQAKYFYEQAKKQFIDNECELAYIYNLLALDYQRSNKIEEAKKHYLNALSFISKCNYDTREEKADIYNNLATLSNLSKNYNTAKYYLSQAKQVIPKDDLFLSSNNLLIYSATLAANKDYLLAKENFLEALKLRKKLFPEKHPFVALAYHYTAEKLYANRHQHHTALAYYQQALEQLVIDFEYCGNKYENPPIKDVQINDRLVLLEVLALKAKSLQAIENQSLAQSTLQLAIDLIDDIRLNYLAEGSKYILLEKAMPIYEQAIALGLEMQELAWAFEVAERSKATLLLESIQNNEAQIYAGIDSTLLQKEQAQKVEIAFYERLLNEANSEEDKQQYQQVLFDLRQDYHQFLAQLEADHPDYYQLKYNLQFPSAADIQQQILEDESALLEYFVSNEFIYLFTLTKEDVAIQKIPKSEDFEQNLQAFRALISSPESTPNSFAQYTNQAFSVYDAYLKDALEKLPNNIQKLLFIPDGALNYIPFQALIEHPIATPKIEQARFDTLSYLTKKYAISYAYSSNLLLSMNQQKPKKTLKFGGFAPIFSGEKVVALRNTMLNELPYSRTEVQQINKLMQGEPFFKQNASLENFKQQAGEFNILHLSTHAALDDQNPDQSRIHLYDDYITVNEIYNLPIRADLTVLSACETGVGKFKRGEGLLSLARAFMYAGCPSLVTSLWQVNDQKTASLMINFYGELANGRTKAKALQIAQINYLNNISTAQAAHPFYWAAFVQTGNSAALIQERLQMNWVWFLMFPLLLVLAWWTSSKIT